VEVDWVGDIGVVQLDSPSVGAAPVDEIAEQLDFRLPESATPAAIAAIHDRLRELGLRWSPLDEGSSMVLTFYGPHQIVQLRRSTDTG
jgi:hypothetical protein